MKYLHLFFCITSLTATGSSLLCMQCSAVDESSCIGQERKCPSHDYVCAATNTLSIMEGKTFKNFTRTCERRSSCGITGSIGFQKGKIKTATSCCDADSCTPSMPLLPSDNGRKTGLTCRSCTSRDSTWCYTEQTIECTGEEDRCILQYATITGSRYSKTAVRGCATKSLCDVGNQYHNFGDLKITRDVTCTSGSSTFHHNLILFTLTTLFSRLLIL
ncbi:urokinase plasminogen activator surface receptor-like [Bombina bombina]|uniref:urokinase plasminogen activator surface receptor-like n=1 Tax=Bombina bombina TaxID=8345 RepID=UPI00235ADACF|nr:urokinase plasminogen activator surface receptor-like [Bombina bombina]